MEGLSERAYAAHSGLSRGAVQKARKAGRLELFADGSINVTAPDTRRVTTTDPDHQLRSRGGFGAGVGSDGGNAVSGPGDSTSWVRDGLVASGLPRDVKVSAAMPKVRPWEAR
jgi:hypothetical protein